MPTTRPARREDWPPLWPMIRAMGTHHPESDVYARYLRTLDNPAWAVIVSTAEEQLVGYATIQDYGSHLRTGDDHRMARLHDLWVDPEHRRHGIGRGLLDAVMGWAGQRVHYLEWQAHEHRSAPFYERLGYHGDPCLQPDYPTFIVDFAERDRSADR